MRSSKPALQAPTPPPVRRRDVTNVLNKFNRR